MTFLTRPMQALLIAAFTNSFNDSALKLGLLLLFTSRGSAGSLDVLFLALAVLPVLPNIIVSPLLARIGDSRRKEQLLQWTKFAEMILVMLGGYLLTKDRLFGSVAIVFLLGAVSAAFTPLKYAIIPELLTLRELSKANGAVICAKYSGILASIITVGALALLQIDIAPMLLSITSAAAALGFAASTQITNSVRPVRVDATIAAHLKQSWREITQSNSLFLVMFSFAYFLILGAIFLSNTTVYLKQAAEFTDLQIAITLCALTLGIALGGVISGIVSRSHVEIGLVPVGAFGVAFILGLQAIWASDFPLLVVLNVICGICGGVSVVPLNAFFQQNSPPRQRACYQAISNAFANTGLLLAGITLLGFEHFTSLGPRAFFAFFSIVTLALSIKALRLMPIALIRCLVWIFTHSVYKIRVFGSENIPQTGGALLICNHISYFDPLLISAAVPRSVRFLILRPLFQHRLLGPVLRCLRAIPISAEDPPKTLVKTLQEARAAVEQGAIVCVFAEGEPSRIGHMLPFARGMEKIMRGLRAPVIPVYLDQTWGSLFDRSQGRYRLKFPKEIPYPASVTFGAQQPANVSAFAMRQVVSELGTTAFTNRKREHQFLHLGFIQNAKRHPFRPCMAQADGKRLTYFKALVGSFLFADYLKAVLKPGLKNVGVLLPPGIGSGLTNIALLLKGYVPVNLNYICSKEASDSCVAQGRIKQVVTSRLFCTKVTPPANVEFIYAEDVTAGIKKSRKILFTIGLLLCPASILTYLVRDKKATHNDLATIIFSSGSTGIPKGVMLSHGNISSNVEAMYNVLAISAKDVIVGVLPFFHSFGYATGLWLPLLGGLKAAYHFSPLESENIGKLIRQERGTILLSTPTFVMNYTRKIPLEDLATLRWAIVGAEKLRTRIAQAFKEKFGFVPLEGYGCTELSPVAMINVPDLKEGARDQIGNKPGTVGHPMPGIAVRVVNTETRVPVAPGEMGVLLVKGPNVMQGYLDQPEKTAEVIWDGWYVTGDLASLDEDGFVTLHDRISRFSKIAGEMVPHGGVEDAIQKVLGEADMICAVSATPDEKRGERLLVLHTKPLDPRAVARQLSDLGLPNLWIPHPEDFFPVETIPCLGSGKMDLQGIKKLARELDALKNKPVLKAAGA